LFASKGLLWPGPAADGWAVLNGPFRVTNRWSGG